MYILVYIVLMFSMFYYFLATTQQTKLKTETSNGGGERTIGNRQIKKHKHRKLDTSTNRKIETA